MRAPNLEEIAHEGERHLRTLDPESRNHYRHLTAYHFALEYCRGRSVLDYGCGTGFGRTWSCAGPRRYGSSAWT
jgi:hypothetical protein